MIIKKLKLPELSLIYPKVFEDDRGFFYEAYNQTDFELAIGSKINFVQDNHSKSIKGVLRGLHYQVSPYEQGKLIRVIHGEIWDVAVDIRKDSKTFGKWVGETLSASNKKQLWIPEGFAHGFYVISDIAEIVYKVNKSYSKDHERIIHWQNNPFNIEWPIKDNLVYLSSKDSEANDKIHEIKI